MKYRGGNSKTLKIPWAGDHHSSTVMCSLILPSAQAKNKTQASEKQKPIDTFLMGTRMTLRKMDSIWLLFPQAAFTAHSLSKDVWCLFPDT